MKNKKEKITVLLFIIISSIFVSIPLVKLNVQYDDGIQHVVRLIETLKSIKTGGIFPVIMQNLCNGFGYSWNLFYSPLTAYLPLIFRILGVSFGVCLKLFMFFVSIASGYSMYFFMRKILSDKEIEENRKIYISILAASFYIMAPYRLTDMYKRVAVSELTSFIFIPIIFNGLYTIINQKKKSLILAFGVIGLLLSHSLIAFYTAILCLIYLLVNIKEIKLSQLFELLRNLMISLLITAFYWIPLIESRLSANYEVFNQAHMVREDALISLKVEPAELLFIKNNRMAYFLGLPIIVGIVLTFIIAKKIKDKKNYFLFLVLGLICVILTLDFIPFEKFPNVMKMMQFSFRLLEFSTFFLTVIASINLGYTIKKFNLFPLIVLIFVMGDLLIPIVNNISYEDEYYSEELLMQTIPITEKTGRVHAGCASFEYLPTKAFEHRDYIVSREDTAIALDGDVEITDFNKNGLNSTFKAKGNGTIELPYIYYIGYTAKIDNKEVDITESENGFCQININTNELTSSQNELTGINTNTTENNLVKVEVSYTGTLAMKVSLAISIIATLILTGFIIKNLFITYRNNS